MGFRVLGFRVWGLGFRVEEFDCKVSRFGVFIKRL